MAARTRAKPSKGGRGKAPVKAVGRRRSGQSAYATVHDLLIRRESIGVGLALLALLAVPWLVPFTSGLADARNRFVATFGLLIFAWIGLLIYAGWLVIRGEQARLWQDWKPWAIGLLSGLFLLGFFGLFNPAWSLGDVSLADHTAGGDLGGRIVGNPFGVLAWLLIGVVAFAVTWPDGAATIARNAPSATRTAWGWHIPSRVAHGARTAFEFVFPTRPQPQGSAKMPIDSVMWARSAGATAEVDDDEDDVEPAPAPVQAPLFPDLEHAPDDEDGDGTPGVTTDARGNRRSRDGWQLPAMDILADRAPAADGAADNAQRASLIEETLASFGVDARVVQINEGPTVTQFGIEPGWEIKTRTVIERDKDGKPIIDKDGTQKTRVEEVSRTRVRVQQITSLANDMALALAAPSIRIEAPVPGKPVLGIEVPNTSKSLVTLRSVVQSPQFQRQAAKSKLSVALGQSVAGEPIVADLAKMPHLLIAGATGSGKSVCMNSIISCILMHASPAEVRMVMIDPKRVELSAFAAIPHLAFSNIVVDMDKVVGTLQAVIHEMESRYRKFAAIAVRNIDGYNRSPRATDKLPYWIVIIDELADLMMAAPFEVERQLCRLAQLARATGIHLVVATQRPSVDVITGLIKANFPTRIAFAVSSQIDSRTILDMGGAEKLLGRGDMLYMAPDAAKPRRLQGVFVSDEEIERLVGFWTQERFADIDRPVFDNLYEEAKLELEMEGASDDMLERATELAREHNRISTSLLQRRLRIGYPRAARLMDLLEQHGVVGPAEGGGSREVVRPDDDRPTLHHDPEELRF
ncbi:MAG TPA: DNA translocase FtsK [Dehalococcoidia bacterium]|nr:DNA translocase FtsK [Dehalococcoidia bacterium]